MRNPPKNTQKKARTSKFKNLYNYEVPQAMSQVGIYKSNLSLLAHTLGTRHQHPIKLDQLKGEHLQKLWCMMPKRKLRNELFPETL